MTIPMGIIFSDIAKPKPINHIDLCPGETFVCLGKFLLKYSLILNLYPRGLGRLVISYFTLSNRLTPFTQECLCMGNGSYQLDKLYE